MIRLKMRKQLETSQNINIDKMFHSMLHADAKTKEQLSKLYYQAFHETVDDEGESLSDWEKEVQNVFREKYGPVMGENSFYLEEGEEIIANILVTFFRGIPLIGFLAVSERARQRGLGRMLLLKACESLKNDGYQQVFLAVNEKNLVASSLYRSLGFEVLVTDWDEILKAQ